jgi:putative transposase
MLVLECKVKAKQTQYRAIDEAIRTVQFIRNKCIRHWMDAPNETKINRFALNKYSTELRNETHSFLHLRTKNPPGYQRGNQHFA